MNKYLVFLLISFLVGCSISQKHCHELYNCAKEKQFDVIVVPGLPYNGDKWNRILRGRVYWAKHLYDAGIAKNIMFSGSAVYTPYVEAEIMALYAREIGIPDSVIFVETKAEHSTENIYYSFLKSNNLGFKTVAFASDPFQSKRMKKFIRNKVKTVELIPFVFDTLSLIEPIMKNPGIKDSLAYEHDFISIEERESLWKRLKGTRGKCLNESYYINGEIE